MKYNIRNTEERIREKYYLKKIAGQFSELIKDIRFRIRKKSIPRNIVAKLHNSLYLFLIDF
jgi:hypothetical protein